MPQGIDYSKWNVIEDLPESLEITDSSRTRSEKLGGLKLEADGLFAAAEKSKDPHDYRVALNQGYGTVLAEIKRAFLTNPSMSDQLRIFEISCKLNSSCCHVKLLDWTMTIEVCSEIISDPHSICSQIQLVRARYFRSYAYYRLASEESFDLAESDANSMKSILSIVTSIDRQSAAEYANHFQTLQKERRILQREDCAIGFESILHRSRSTYSKKGWSLYIHKKFGLSSAWFASQLLDMTDACKADPSKRDLLHDLYNGYAKSQSALNNYVEAAKAFLTAVSYSVSSEVKIGLHLQVAALCYISGEYDRSSASYATALLMNEDLEKVSPLESKECHKPLIKAIANAGLGLCYCKFKEYSRAVEHLKTAIGLFTDDMFITHKITPRNKLAMPISMSVMGLMIPDVVEDEHGGQMSSDLDIDREEERTLTLSAAATQAYHLLNALEALSDAYAALRDWEKAMYTANCAIEVCQALLVSLSITGVSGILSLDADGAPASRPPEITTAIVSKVKIKDNFSVALQGQFDHLYDGDELKVKELEALKTNCISTLRLKHASALFAKGHMMMKILCHDINRSNNDCGSVAEEVGQDEGYTFSAMDPSLSVATMQDLMGSKAVIGLENTSVVDVISSLWKKSAREFEEVGKTRRAFSVYKDLAAMWSKLAQVKPHSEFLFRIAEPDEETHIASDKSTLPLSLPLSLPTDGSMSDAQEVQCEVPSQYTNADEQRRAQAAMKAKDSWIAASVVAKALYQSVLCGDENVSVMESTANSSSGRTADESQEVAMLEAQLTAWQEVIQCEYHAGLSALMYSVAEAETQFERAQGSKGTYLELVGTLIEAEKRQLKAHTAAGAATSDEDDAEETNESNTLNVTETFKKMKEIDSQRWLTYNTLCCDISFHLAYTYIFSKKIADAIAEVEMAIGLAKVSSDSISRKIKCWGILAVGFNAAGQALEAERALKECTHLRPISSGDGEDEYVKKLRHFMDHNAPRKRREVLAPLRVADKYGSKGVETQEPKLESGSRTTIKSIEDSKEMTVSTTLSLKSSASGQGAFSNLAIILYIGVTIVFSMILSICVAFYL